MPGHGPPPKGTLLRGRCPGRPIPRLFPWERIAGDRPRSASYPSPGKRGVPRGGAATHRGASLALPRVPMAAARCAPGAVSPGAAGAAPRGAAHPSAVGGPRTPAPATLGARRGDPGAPAGTKFVPARSPRSLPRARTRSLTNHLTGADAISRLEETWGAFSSSSNPAPITR